MNPELYRINNLSLRFSGRSFLSFYIESLSRDLFYFLTKERCSTLKKKSYFEDGFVIPDFRLDQETLEQVLSDHDRLLKKHPEFLNYCPNVLAYDLSFLNYARIPGILAGLYRCWGRTLHSGTRVFLPNRRSMVMKPPGIKTVNIGPSGPWPPARFGLQWMKPPLKTGV